MKVVIRVLSEKDAEAYQDLRLRSLREYPEAFGRSFEDEKRVALDKIAKKLKDSCEENYSLGAFENERLLGILNFFRYYGEKVRHRALITNMYVIREEHGKGIGKTLLTEVICKARSLPGLEELTLAATVGNKRARRLYISAGFIPVSIEPRYIKLNNRYYDIEWMSFLFNDSPKIFGQSSK